jgi:hypothetical protein
MKGNSQSFGLLKIVCGLLVAGGCIGLDGKGVANLLGAGIRLAADSPDGLDADSPDHLKKQCKMTFKDTSNRFTEFAVVHANPATQDFIGVTMGCSAGNAFNIYYSSTGPCGPWEYKKYIAFHDDGLGLKYFYVYHYKDAPSWMYEFWATFLMKGD